MAELDLRQVSTTLLGLEQEVRASLPTLATTPSEQQADAEGAKLRGIVQKLEDSIQRFSSRLGEIKDDDEREKCHKELAVHDNEVESLRIQIRAALLKSQVFQRKNQIKVRQALLQRAESASGASAKDQNDLERSKALTGNVSRLRGNLQGLTEQGKLINERLEESSKVIEDVIGEHDEIESELRTARKLITNLRMRETMDKILIALAMIFYLSVCVFIIFSRLKTPVQTILGLFSPLFNLFSFGSSSSSPPFNQTEL